MANRKPKRQVKRQPATDSAVSGIAEFDSILRGGFPRNRMCLLQGSPGSGKTTLALQFLLAGAQQGEKGAYITFSETAAELRQSARLVIEEEDGATAKDHGRPCEARKENRVQAAEG